jgi:hypothetical protein
MCKDREFQPMTRSCSTTLLAFLLLALLTGTAVAQTTVVAGREFSGAIERPEQDLRMTGRMFVPQSVAHVRIVIVVVRWGNGPDFYHDEHVRALAASISASVLLTEFQTMTNAADNRPKRADQGGADGLRQLVRQFATDADHQALAQAPFIFWGHSAAGPFGAGFAALHPERTIAFIRYHSGPMAGGEVPSMTRVPALFLVGGKDAATGAPGGWIPPGVEGAKALWQFGRSGKAPWTFALDPNADHGSPEGLARANALVVPWIAAVVHQRLQDDGGRISDIPDRAGWVANIDTGEVARAGAPNDARGSWLPDEESARAWRVLRGPNR